MTFCRFRRSPTGSLHAVAQRHQFRLDPLAHVALNLDYAVFDSPARAAELLEDLRQRLQLVARQRNAADRRHRLAAASLAVAGDAHEAVLGRSGHGGPAPTLGLTGAA